MSGKVQVGNFPSGGGGGGATSVSNADGTLTISPTTGAVVASLDLAKANTWTALQTFNGGVLAPAGQTIEVSDGASAAVSMSVAAFADATLNVTSQNGSAIFAGNTNKLGGLYVGAPFTTPIFAIGVTGTPGLGLTDSGAGDSVITAVGTAVRIGVGTGASTVQVTATGIGVTSPKSIVNGSTSGSAIFAQPEFGASYKRVVVFLSALVGTASYTYPTPFLDAPMPVGPNAALATAISATAVTVTAGSATTGFLILEGF